MNLLINVTMAWLTVVLMVSLALIYLLRLWIQKSGLPKDSPVRTWNKRLRKPHKWIGVTAVVTGLLHGIYSSMAVLSPNKGTILWLMMILLGFSWIFRKRLSAWKSWIKVHRILAAVSFVLLLLHVLEVGGFVGFDPVINAVKSDLQQDAAATESVTQSVDSQVTSEEAGKEEKTDDNPYKNIPDGTYEGSAEGFRPGLLVSVKIQDGRIMEVVVLDHNEEKERFWGEPVEKIPLAIVQTQSTEVDIISGATFTSVGIMKAVGDALNNAFESGAEVPREEEEEAMVSDSEALVGTEAGGLEEASEETEIEAVPDQEVADETGAEADVTVSQENDEVSAQAEALAQEPENVLEAETETQTEPDALGETQITEVAIQEEIEVSEDPIQEETQVTNEEVPEEPQVAEEPVQEETAESDYTEGEGAIEDAVTEEAEVPVEEVPTVSEETPLIETYTGSGFGYDGWIVVEVTLEDGALINVEIISHEERVAKYWKKPVELLPDRIIEAQSTDVDAISGATITSEAIFDAVEEALQQR